MAHLVFVGLGNMGYPMAGHLARAGHAVTVVNRSPAKAGRWVAEHGGARAPTPREAARGAEAVFLCVGNDDDLRAVTLGADGVLGMLAPGALVVDHTTTSATVARDVATAAAARGVEFLDAPVSGGQAGAVNGQLTVMCGGTAAAFARAEPLLAAYARTARLLGPSGAGQLAKMVNQVLIAGVLQGLAEGLAFGAQVGLDLPAVIEVIRQGAAQSWQLDNRAATMCRREYDFGFAVDWMRKDLGIVLDEARRGGIELPNVVAVDARYAELQARGFGRADTSSLVEALRVDGPDGAA